jgi:hypothetical protein
MAAATPPTTYGSGWVKIDDIQNTMCKWKEPFDQLCGKASSRVLCAALSNYKTFFQDARASAQRCEEQLTGLMHNPQSTYRSPDPRVGWKTFNENTAQALLSEKVLRKSLSHLGGRAMTHQEINKMASSHQLSQVYVELRKVPCKGEHTIFFRVTIDMGNKLYAFWHRETFPDFHKKFTRDWTVEHQGDLVEALLGIAWIAEATMSASLQPWIHMSVQMQQDIENTARVRSKDKS